MARAAAPNAIPTLAIFFAPRPVKIAGGVAVAVVLPPLVGLPTNVKLAHVMRVLFAKWKVTERLPKKEPRPGRVDA
jgi:hypothetical protein